MYTIILNYSIEFTLIHLHTWNVKEVTPHRVVVFTRDNEDAVPVVNNVAQPVPTSHLSSDAAEASRPNKSHMVYYYGLSLHHKTLNWPALTRCC